MSSRVPLTTSQTLRISRIGAALAVGTLLLTGCEPIGGDGPEEMTYYSEPHGEEEEPRAGSVLEVPLVGADGAEVGVVEILDGEEGTEVSVEAEGLEPGFHGLHVHAVGECEPDSADPEDPATTGDFLSAGGHWSEGDEDHGDHAGDLPSLYADEEGAAHLVVHTDAFEGSDLEDEDGSAIVIHAGADNFANIPERYAPDGPDEETLSAGDSGDRVACGVVEPS